MQADDGIPVRVPGIEVGKHPAITANDAPETRLHASDHAGTSGSACYAKLRQQAAALAQHVGALLEPGIP